MLLLDTQESIVYSSRSAWTSYAAWTSAFGHVTTDTFVGIALTRWCLNRARFAVAL